MCTTNYSKHRMWGPQTTNVQLLYVDIVCPYLHWFHIKLPIWGIWKKKDFVFQGEKTFHTGHNGRRNIESDLKSPKSPDCGGNECSRQVDTVVSENKEVMRGCNDHSLWPLINAFVSCSSSLVWLTTPTRNHTPLPLPLGQIHSRGKSANPLTPPWGSNCDKVKQRGSGKRFELTRPWSVCFSVIDSMIPT